MPSIIIVSGPSEGEYYPLVTSTVVIGRDGKCPIQILDDKMSRVHLEIRHDKANGVFVAKDLKSVNGVTINANRISDEVQLADGDLIEVGDSQLMFFNKEFADRKSAWNAYKMAGERVRPTIIEPPKPAAKKGLFGGRG